MKNILPRPTCDLETRNVQGDVACGARFVLDYSHNCWSQACYNQLKIIPSDMKGQVEQEREK